MTPPSLSLVVSEVFSHDPIIFDTACRWVPEEGNSQPPSAVSCRGLGCFFASHAPRSSPSMYPPSIQRDPHRSKTG
jgi:hypothetical protein